MKVTMTGQHGLALPVLRNRVDAALRGGHMASHRIEGEPLEHSEQFPCASDDILLDKFGLRSDYIDHAVADAHIDPHDCAQDPLLQMYWLRWLAKTGRSNLRQPAARPAGSPRSDRLDRGDPTAGRPDVDPAGT